MTITEFIEMLDKALEGNLDTYVCDEDGCTYIRDTDDIDWAASGLFIGTGGFPNYEAMRQLKELSHGKYFITPGETDSFGWLSGCINTPKGIIVYF